MSEQIFELKGNLFTLSVLHLFSADTSLLSKQLDEKIAQAPKFFAGAPIVINLSDVQGDSFDFSFLKSMLTSLSFNPVGVCLAAKSKTKTPKRQAYQS